MPLQDETSSLQLTKATVLIDAPTGLQASSLLEEVWSSDAAARSTGLVFVHKTVSHSSIH